MFNHLLVYLFNKHIRNDIMVMNSKEIIISKVKLTIMENRCRGGYCKAGDVYIVEDLCPPLCHELWNSIYPLVYALQNGSDLDYGNIRAKKFDAKCMDEGRVCVYGEVIEDEL